MKASATAEIVDRDAIQIGELYARSNGSLAESIAARIECGRRLIEKKATMAHGAWLPWLAENAGTLGFVHWKTASRLMRVAGAVEPQRLAAAESNGASTLHLDEAEAVKLSRQLWGNENLRAAVGTDSAGAAERGNNLYETPPEAMKTLLSVMRFSQTVWEPACGRGAISKMLEDAGYGVILADLVDYGTADRFGEVQKVGDFLQSRPGDIPGTEGADIVTNPPYGEKLNAFVAHALRVHRPKRMALLLNLNFLCGFDDPDRNFAMDENPPAAIWVFTRRLPMMHRDGWDGPEASSRMNTAWFVWELDEATQTYDAARGTQIVRIDWKTFENSTPAGPLPSPLAGEGGPARNGGTDEGCCEERGGTRRGFVDALSDWSELNRLKALGGAATPEQAARRAALAPIVAADLAPVSVQHLSSGPADAGPPSPAKGEGGALPIMWRQPFDGGRILALAGSVELGAVFPNHDGSAGWCFWLGVPSGVASHRPAKSVDKAKAALAKQWREFQAAMGMPA